MRIKSKLTGLLLGALCAAGAVTGTLGVTAVDAMAEVSSVSSVDKLNPTLLNLNRQYTLNINMEKDGSYFYFKTDSSTEPYRFEILNSLKSYGEIRIQCYEIGVDTDSSNALIRAYCEKNDSWIKTYEDTFKPNTKYLLYIDDVYGVTTNNYSIQLKITHKADSTTNASITNIVKIHNGKWTYFKNGLPDYTFTGLAKTSSGAWVYVRKGLFYTSWNGMARSATNNWYYVAGGIYDTDFTGLAKSETGSWYHITNGKYNTGYTGLSRAASGKWYYVKNGKYDKTYTGLAKAPSGKWYYVKNGKYDTSYSGRVRYNGKYYTVRNGKVV